MAPFPRGSYYVCMYVRMYVCTARNQWDIGVRAETCRIPRGCTLKQLLHTCRRSVHRYVPPDKPEAWISKKAGARGLVGEISVGVQFDAFLCMYSIQYIHIGTVVGTSP